MFFKTLYCRSLALISLDYLIIKILDEGEYNNRKIVVSEALLESVIKDCKIQNFENLKKFKGKFIYFYTYIFIKYYY